MMRYLSSILGNLSRVCMNGPISLPNLWTRQRRDTKMTETILKPCLLEEKINLRKKL